MNYDKYTKEQELLFTEMSDMIGKQFQSITVNRGDGDDSITFVAYTGEVYKFYHQQDCCEDVEIEDVCGHWDDLLHTPLLVCEISDNRTGDNGQGSETWTFYKFATVNGWVDVRWYGTSNGYYSEEVSFERVK